jgi:hypothetical protein
MAENMDDNIKKAQAYKDSLDAINKTLETQASRIGTLTSEMGIAFGAWQSQTKKTQEDRLKEIKLLNDATKSVQGQKAAISEAFNDALKLDGAFKKMKTSTEQFSDAMSSVGTKNIIEGLQGVEDVEKRMNDLIEKHGEEVAKQTDEFKDLKKIKEKFYTTTKDFNKENEDHFSNWLDSNEEINKILNELPFDSISDQMEFIKKLREGDLSAAEQVLATDKLDAAQKQKLIGLTKNLADSQQVVSDIQAESVNQMKAETNLLSKIANVAKANSENAFNAITSKIKEIDQSLKDAQKDFGMSFDGAYIQMAELTSEAARFGMSTKDTVEMMGQLGDELKTTDTKYLASATEHFIAIQKATGISSEEVTTIAGEMMRAGKSAEQVEGFMDESNKIAKKFGVNTKKVLQGVSKNIDKMRQMGFQGGEESLARMAARAERLNMDMDEMFDVAKKARNIEGAMEMASELQLAGGSFANIDPMSLLAAARKGPEELQKILTQMGGDIGNFNKKTGELEFDAVDADRLQMVADATGQTVDSIQKGLQKAAADNAKLDVLGLDSSIGEDAKNFLSDMTTMKDGELSVSPELSDLASSAGIDISNVDDLKNLSKEETDKLLAAKADKEKSLEEQALANQSFQESLTAFKDSIMSMFTVFEPVLNMLTGFIQSLSEFGPVGQVLGAALVGFVAFGPKLIGAFGSFKEGVSGISDSFKGFKEKGIKGIFTGATKAPTEAALPGADSKDATPKGGGGLQSLAEGLKAMGDPKVFAGIGAVALAAPALVLMLAGIPTIMLMAVVGAMGKLVEAGFRAVANGISAVGEAKGVLKGALAMVIIGAALIPFAFALQMMAAVEWSTIGMMVVGIIALAGVTALLGFIAPLMLMGALALAAASVGLLIFSAAIMVFATASQMMQGMNFDWLGSLGWNLLLAAPGLLLGGLALMVAAPALIFGSMGLMALGVAAQALSGVDWSAFSAIGPALSSLSLGLIAFSLAGLMFANPITLLGMLLMIGNLGMLAAIMAPLSQSLNTGADGLERFADGLAKLQAAANSLDFERLEALKELSVGMATSGAGGGMGDQIQKIADALAALTKGGGSGGGGGNKKIEINLKLNGRQLQEIIIDDTSIVS